MDKEAKNNEKNGYVADTFYVYADDGFFWFNNGLWCKTAVGG